MIDQGIWSTRILTLVGLIYAIVIGLQAQGLIVIGVPEQYAAIVILIVTIVWNYINPRQNDTVPVPEEVETTEEDKDEGV
ncbi:MAG: hypothetical protein QHH15_00315 [Candidatus Thermoplasmatota archaeon]|nr:hypothetical protein [Candidatus Thermoplasmatota archaeon]